MFFPQSDNLCLLIGVFHQFTFHLINNIVEFKSTIFLFIFYLPPLFFCFSFPVLCVWVCGNQVIFSILFHLLFCWLFIFTSLYLFLGTTMYIHNRSQSMLNYYNTSWIMQVPCKSTIPFIFWPFFLFLSYILLLWML